MLSNRWQPQAPSFSRVPVFDPQLAPALPAKSPEYTVLPGWSVPQPTPATTTIPVAPDAAENHPQAVDPFYLFACHVEWQLRGEPSAAWELLAAARSSHPETQAHARALLASIHPVAHDGAADVIKTVRRRSSTLTEENMKLPYGLDIIESCSSCTCSKTGFFCELSLPVTQAVDRVSHHSNVPAGAILFVEGQLPRGLFVICSGRVKLSTTSRDGKVLVLKTADAGEPLGLSAAISGDTYEMTAETATPCQITFMDRKALLELLQAHSEIGLHASRALSRDFQSAYREMHDLVLARSSAGKLARLLLSCSPTALQQTAEVRLRSSMTHEEMAQRIGSSRETVTRLLSNLKRKQLIRLDGTTLVIRDRTKLEALAL